MPRRNRELRLAIAQRDGWACWICGMPITGTLPMNHPGAASIDHAIPRALGGTDELANLKLAHRRCNELRGTSMAVLTTADRMRLRDLGAVARA